MRPSPFTSIIIDQSYQYTLSEVLEATAPLSGADRHYVARCKQMLTPPLVYALNSEFNLLNSLKNGLYLFLLYLRVKLMISTEVKG